MHIDHEISHTKYYADYKWIKVKRYVPDESKSWMERYHDLEKHHVEETQFMIDEVRKLASILDYRESRMDIREIKLDDAALKDVQEEITSLLDSEIIKDLNAANENAEQDRLMSLSDEEFDVELMKALRTVSDSDDSWDNFMKWERETHPAMMAAAYAMGKEAKAAGFERSQGLVGVPQFCTPSGNPLKVYNEAWMQGWDDGYVCSTL